MIAAFSRLTLITYKKWEHTWDMEFIQANARFCTSAEPGSQSTPSISSMAGSWGMLNMPVTLGVSTTNDLCWNTHIIQTTSKANLTLGFVKRNVRTKT